MEKEIPLPKENLWDEAKEVELRGYNYVRSQIESNHQNELIFIKLLEYSKLVIENYICNNDRGIQIRDGSSNNTVINNTLHNNDAVGIRLQDLSQENRIFNNSIGSTNAKVQNDGIYLFSFCHNNTIKGNLIFNHTVSGIQLQAFSHFNSIINDCIIITRRSSKNSRTIIVFFGWA